MRLIMFLCVIERSNLLPERKLKDKVRCFTERLSLFSTCTSSRLNAYVTDNGVGR